MKRLFLALTLMAVSFPVSALARDKTVKPQPAKIVERDSACLSISIGPRYGENFAISGANVTENRIIETTQAHMMQFVAVPLPIATRPYNVCSLAPDSRWTFQVAVFITMNDNETAILDIRVEIDDRQNNVRVGRPDVEGINPLDLRDSLTLAFIRALQAEPAQRVR